MLRLLILPFLFHGIALAGEAKPAPHEDATLATIEAQFAAIQAAAAKHQGLVSAEVVRIDTQGDWIHDSNLSQPRLRRIKFHLVFKITKVLSGPMVLEDSHQPRSLLLEEKIEPIDQSISLPGDSHPYGYTQGQVIQLRYALGLCPDQASIANSKLQYHITRVPNT